MLHFSQLSQQSTIGPASQCSSQHLSHKLHECFLATPLPLSLDLSDTEDRQMRDISNQSCGMVTALSQPCSQLNSQFMGTQELCTPAEDQNLGFRPHPVLSPNRAKRARSTQDTTMREGNGMDASTPCSADGTGRLPSGRIPPLSRLQQPCVQMQNVFLGSDFEKDSKENAAQPRLLPVHTSSGRFRNEFQEQGYLGEGSFAQVVKVKHRFDGREYAVKRSKQPVTSPLAMAGWRQEVHAWSALPVHKSLVRYYGAWQEADQAGGNHVFIQLERCGANLADIGRAARGENADEDGNGASQPVDESTLITLLSCMAEALAVVHSSKMVHMDIKPGNMFASVPEGTFKLGDFGTATSKSAAIHDEGDSRYLAREVLNGDTRHLEKGDMFALGASLYELATGCPLPKEGSAYQDLREGKLKLLPVATDNFRKVVADLMHPDPELRPSARKILTYPLFRKGKTAAQQYAASSKDRATQINLNLST